MALSIGEIYRAVADARANWPRFEGHEFLIRDVIERNNLQGNPRDVLAGAYAIALQESEEFETVNFSPESEA